MKVKIHALFEYLLKTTLEQPEATLGFSLATSPRLGDFLDELDPNLSLDWSNQSFQGLPALRRHILKLTNLKELCALDDILITAGAAEANFLAITQLVQPGDEIIAEQPGWLQPFVLGEAIPAKIKVLRRREAANWEFNLDELAWLISEKTKLIFLSNPNNPTGGVLREERLRQIAGMAKRVGAYLLCDEVYAGLEWSGGRVPSVAGIYERGISVGSVSKALGLQGLRIGWLICRDSELVHDAVILRENSSEIMNVMGEFIAEIAARPERYEAAIGAAQAEGRANLRLLNQFIDSRQELGWQMPAAGLIGLCRLHTPFNSDYAAQKLLQPPYRTFLIPGSAYGCPQHIRLGVGGGEAARLEVGLSRLGDFLDDERKRV